MYIVTEEKIRYFLTQKKKQNNMKAYHLEWYDFDGVPDSKTVDAKSVKAAKAFIMKYHSVRIFTSCMEVE